MSSIQIARNFRSGMPEWTPEELEGKTNSPGDNAVDGMINPFATTAGWLFTETAASKVAGIGGTLTFSDKYTFPSTTLCRQANASICAPNWVICVSYDPTNGTVCHYSTDGWATVNQVTISSGINGSGRMPGLWVDQRVPGRAIATAFTGSFTAYSGDFTFDFTVAQYGSTTNTTGTSWVSGEGWKKAAGSDAGATGNRVILPAVGTVSPGTFLSIYVQISTSDNTSLNFGWETAVLRRADNTFTDTNQWYGPYTAFSGSGQNLTCWIQHSNSVTTWIEKMRINTDGSVAPLDAGAAAFLTTDYGATWTEITGGSVVGYIQPGTYLSGAMDAPYTDATPYRFAYGYIDDGGTYPVPLLHRVVTTTVTDISPVADGKTYGVPYDKPHHRAICISVKDANTAILCGESRDADTGDSVYRVFLTRNLWDTTPTWTPLTDESATLDWHGVYIAGDTPNAAYFLGTNGNAGVWESDIGSTILDKRGDSTKTGNAVWLCGL